MNEGAPSTLTRSPRSDRAGRPARRGAHCEIFVAYKSTNRAHVTHAMADQDNFVPITGVVYQATSLGVFLDVGDRRVFIPANCMSMPSRVFASGETVTVEVLRRFAQHEGLIP